MRKQRFDFNPNYIVIVSERYDKLIAINPLSSTWMTNVSDTAIMLTWNNKVFSYLSLKN